MTVAWQRALATAAPSKRVPVVLDTLPSHPVEAWPAMLAAAFRGADFLADARERLLPVLRALHARRLRIFDSGRARRAFDALPSVIEVYRGTCMAEHESRQYGISWSTDRAVAEGFALRHEIARLATRGRPDVGAQLVRDGFASDSVVLHATVRRDNVTGLLLRRREFEVIVLPEHLTAIEIAPEPVPIYVDDYCEGLS